MKRIPWRLQTALLTEVDDTSIELDPIARCVFVVTPELGLTRHRIDLYDGLSPRVMSGSADITVDVCAAIGDLLMNAMNIATDYEQAALAALSMFDNPNVWREPPYARIALQMRAYVNGLRSLRAWQRFLLILDDRRLKRERQ